MEFAMKYPKRVTKGEDGIYRWSFDVDLKKDHSIRNQTLKILLIVCGSVCAIMWIMMAALHDFSMAWIPAACCGVVFLITLAGFAIYRAMVGNRYTACYEMDEEKILAVKTPAMQKGMKYGGIAMAALGTLAGRPVSGLGRGAAMYAAAEDSPIRFGKVRKIKRNPDTCMIYLKEVAAFTQIWIPEEDYAMVSGFILEHTPSDAVLCGNPHRQE